MRVMESIVNFLFPTTCLFCKNGSAVCCIECFNAIPKDTKIINNILSVYSFREHKINKLIWKLKYHHSHDIGVLFGSALSKKFISTFTSLIYENDFLVDKHIYLIPIPLTKKDKRIHNHAEKICESMKVELMDYNVTVLSNVLSKNTTTKQAHTHSKHERLRNVSGKFEINLKELPIYSSSDMYVLVDDVTTTGATIAEARGLLSSTLNIPEERIFALALAH